MSHAPKRRSVAVNTAVSLSGRIWQAVLQVMITPITIRLLGPDQYGVASFGGTMLATLMAFDWAVSPILLRELSRRSDSPEWAHRMRVLLFTLQIVSLSIALVVMLSVIAAAPWIAGSWLTSTTLDDASLTFAVMLIGLGMGAQWPGFLYGAGFAALERHDRMVVIFVVGITIQSFVAVSLLYFVAPSVLIFLGWLAATYVALTSAQAIALWTAMPRTPGKLRFSFAVLRPHLGFARGNFLIGLLTMVLTQSDKLIVARTVTLEAFAAYALASFAASTVISFTAAPISASSHPRMTARAHEGDIPGVAAMFHRMAQQMAAVLMPTAMTLAAFADPVLAAWLGRASPLVEPVAALLPWMLAGIVLNTLASVPYLLQNAFAWTWLTITVNVISAPIVVAAFWFGIPAYGAFVGPLVFTLYNAMLMLVQAPIAMRRLIPGHFLRWILIDTLLPIAVSFAVVWGVLLLKPAGLSIPMELVWAAGTGLVSLGVTCFALPESRDTIITLGRRIRRRISG